MAASPSFDLPLACRIGQTCFIQQYFDHDPGPGAKDYRCGTATYDGHDGTDFRLPTLAAQKQGVEVLAAAPGTVKGLRDGMEDVDVTVVGVASVKGRECGNGVLVDHGGGWETQYCHMAKGSVRVHPGEAVKAGTVLGLVGESGDAAFPHLHFSVRRAGAEIDPFAWDAAPGACGTGSSLWSDKAQAALVYRVPQVINAGFAASPLTMDDVESGRAGHSAPDANGGAFVAYVRAIALTKGDVQSFTVTAPDGSAFAGTRVPPLDHDKAQWFTFLGKKRTAGPWPLGRYTARYAVERAGRVVLEKRFDFTMR